MATSRITAAPVSSHVTSQSDLTHQAAPVSSHITGRPLASGGGTCVESHHRATSRIRRHLCRVTSHHRETDLSHHGSTCVESHHITERQTSRITAAPVSIRKPGKVIANGDHMPSKGLLDNISRISIGESRAPRSGAVEFSCRNLSSHHTRRKRRKTVASTHPFMTHPMCRVTSHTVILFTRKIWPEFMFYRCTT